MLGANYARILTAIDTAPARPVASRCRLWRTSSLGPRAARSRALRSSARVRARAFQASRASSFLKPGPVSTEVSPIRTESLRRLTLLSCVRFGPEQTQQAAIDIGMRNLKRPATHQIAQQIDKVILDPARYNAKPPS